MTDRSQESDKQKSSSETEYLFSRGFHTNNHFVLVSDDGKLNCEDMLEQHDSLSQVKQNSNLSKLFHLFTS